MIFQVTFLIKLSFVLHLYFISLIEANISQVKDSVVISEVFEGS